MTTETETIEHVKEHIDISPPGMYNVILHNDDTTTYNFVIFILTNIFNKTIDEAAHITRTVDTEGHAVAGGPYTKEVADEKVSETIAMARVNGFPLVASAEKN